MTTTDFRHMQSAHCESGVTASLFTNTGLELSEPLAFGIGAGLMFAHFPFLKMGNLPLTSYRTRPGAIFKRASKALGVQTASRAFRDPDRATDALDRLLDEGRFVGLQVGAYWLPFFPPALRFHFNGHNLIAYGREGGEYLISDPVLDRTVRCAANALRRARFSKGALAPKGRLYTVQSVGADPDWRRAILCGIRTTARDMAYAPFPIIGVKGIRYVARRMAAWPEKYGEEGARQHLAQLIRMQEEVGTGGAGFRYLYAAFLQEAAERIDEPALAKTSTEMTDIGDLWTEFALSAARVCKGRGDKGYPDLGKHLMNIAEREGTFFRRLGREVRSMRG